MATKLDLRKLTRLRREEESKRRKSEAEERLSVLGQESDSKAAKWVREDVEEKEKQAKKIEVEGLMSLESLRGNKLKYNVFLTGVLSMFLKDEDIPIKYTIDVVANKTGVITSIRNTNYVMAFKSIGIPKFDLFAAKTSAIRVGNTIAHLEGYRSQSEGGILKPDEIDVKKYGHKRTRPN